MNIEESIRELKGYLTWLEANGFSKLAKDSAIETLLTAYEKEEHKKECHNCDEYTARLGELETENRMLISELEKQSKEIEELKDKNKKLKDKAKELIFEKQELTSALLDSTPNDKIKAKIEEVDKEEKEALKGTKGQDRYAIKQEYMHKRSVLQSLLEKE